MNAERLHAVVNEVLDEIQTTKQTETLTKLDQAIERLASNPQDQASQNNVSTERDTLMEALARAPSNEASAGQRQLLNELGIGPLLGTELQQRVEDAFLGNELTPATAAADIGALLNELQALQTTLINLNQSLNELEIGQEELSEDEFELAVLIPRAEVDNALRPLGEELIAFSKIFAPFSELAGEGRPLIPVNSISSSDFMIFLGSTAGTALLVAKTMKILIDAYGAVLDIKEKSAELKELGVTDDELGRITDNANNRVAITIEQLVDTLVEESEGAEKGRENELRTELKRSAWELAVRIDEGYSIDVRVALPAPSGDGDEEEPSSSSQTAAEIRDMRPELQYRRIDGDPILRLPEGLEIDGGDTDE